MLAQPAEGQAWALPLLGQQAQALPRVEAQLLAQVGEPQELWAQWLREPVQGPEPE
ncbi:hypothetical protein GCM10011378_01490 [Hymenobacter glacieicola]|uniref:Uncharacterized protein n=1 Tax=Hymenobacter glacieicola TaxID=1562124 RepID=A0ABQ1WFH7_9BACT|nr:hypothetical protein GCM10011378_01490 [Hymenobacter glacieicola]